MDRLYMNGSDSSILIFMATMLKVQTYNMKGLDDSDEYVRDIISQYQPDIICMQETWYLDNACQQFSTIDDKCFFNNQGVIVWKRF